jgi:hypothetical protein
MRSIGGGGASLGSNKGSRGGAGGAGGAGCAEAAVAANNVDTASAIIRVIAASPLS